MSEADYPYTSGATGEENACGYKRKQGVSLVFTNGLAEWETESIKSIIEYGPVSVAVNADNDIIRNYASGIVTVDDDCPTQLDHNMPAVQAMQAVGYGYEGEQGYYIVRNSWGATWGDQGYIKIGMIDGVGVCGFNQAVWWNLVLKSFQ